MLAAYADQPAALIERARVFAASGRIGPGSSVGMEIHTQLEKLVAEGGQPLAKQTRGVSPSQVAFAELALARVDFARGDLTTARGDLRAVVNAGLDDQRFAEDWVDTLYILGDLAAARAAVDRALQVWPASRRARITLAQILLATGHASDAIDALAKSPDVTVLPLAVAVRGLGA